MKDSTNNIRNVFEAIIVWLIAGGLIGQGMRSVWNSLFAKPENLAELHQKIDKMHLDVKAVTQQLVALYNDQSVRLDKHIAFVAEMFKVQTQSMMKHASDLSNRVTEIKQIILNALPRGRADINKDEPNTGSGASPAVPSTPNVGAPESAGSLENKSLVQEEDTMVSMLQDNQSVPELVFPSGILKMSSVNEAVQTMVYEILDVPVEEDIPLTDASNITDTIDQSEAIANEALQLIEQAMKNTTRTLATLTPEAEQEVINLTAAVDKTAVVPAVPMENKPWYERIGAYARPRILVSALVVVGFNAIVPGSGTFIPLLVGFASSEPLVNGYESAKAYFFGSNNTLPSVEKTAVIKQLTYETAVVKEAPNVAKSYDINTYLEAVNGIKTIGKGQLPTVEQKIAMIQTTKDVTKIGFKAFGQGIFGLSFPTK